MRAKKAPDRKSVLSRYARQAQLMKMYEVFYMFQDAAGTLKEAINADCKLSGAKQSWGTRAGAPFFVSWLTAGALTNL